MLPIIRLAGDTSLSKAEKLTLAALVKTTLLGEKRPPTKLKEELPTCCISVVQLDNATESAEIEVVLVSPVVPQSNAVTALSIEQELTRNPACPVDCRAIPSGTPDDPH